MEEEYDEDMFTIWGAIEYLLNGEGTPLPYGCTQADVSEKIDLAKSVSKKPYCVVSDWQLWNYHVDPAERRMLNNSKVLPIVLYSKNIIFDEQDRSPSGHQIRTTNLIRIVDNCIFESLNTMYIMVGNGCQKSTLWMVISNVRF